MLVKALRRVQGCAGPAPRLWSHHPHAWIASSHAGIRSSGKWIVQGVFGWALGYTVSRMGFGDYAEVQKMFTFADLRLFTAFAAAVAMTAIGFRVMGVRRTVGVPLHPSAAVRTPGGAGARSRPGRSRTPRCPGPRRGPASRS